MKDVIYLKHASIILSSAFLLFSCESKDVRFNKISWNEKNDGFYTNRKEMVNDLISNHLHKGMSYEELVEKLGTPENYSEMDANTIAYAIVEDYGWDIDPVETKILRIKLSKDSLVEDYEIIHWKN
jgi:hypothetical protein